MIERAYVANGRSGQLHYARAGRGPTIVCLHQTPRSWDEFREVILLLQDEFQVIAMDLPGMGASSGADEGASIEAYAQAAINLVETLACGPVILCGHHTGGVVAIELANAQATPGVGDVVARELHIDGTKGVGLVATFDHSKSGGERIDVGFCERELLFGSDEVAPGLGGVCGEGKSGIAKIGQGGGVVGAGGVVEVAQTSPKVRLPRGVE